MTKKPNEITMQIIGLVTQIKTVAVMIAISLCMLNVVGLSRIAAAEQQTSKALASPVLASDALRMIANVDSMKDKIEHPHGPLCQNRSLIGFKVIHILKAFRYRPDGTMREGTWQERWIVDRCGKRVPYIIKFTTMPAGGTKMSIERPFR